MTQRLTSAQFDALFHILDDDESGDIDIEELATFFLNISIEPATGRQLTADERNSIYANVRWEPFMQYFRRFDTNRDGVISQAELRNIINNSHQNVTAAIIGMLTFRPPEVNIADVPRPVPQANAGGGSLTLTSNLSLPGQPAVSLEKLARDFKEYEGADLARLIGRAEAERLTFPIHDCLAIHQGAKRMIYSEEGLRDLECIGGQIGSTSMQEILTTFQHHLERGWNYNQSRLQQASRYPQAGLTMLLRHLLTDQNEGLRSSLQSYTLPHYQNRPNLRLSQFLFGINKYLDKLLQYGQRGEYMHSSYVTFYTEMAVAGYSHENISSYIRYNGRTADGGNGAVTGCAGGNSDRVVLSLGPSISTAWQECERQFPLLANPNPAPVPNPEPGITPRTSERQRNRDAAMAGYIGQGSDIDMASQLAHLDYPSPRPGLNPPPAPGVIPGADERQRNRDAAMAGYIGQGSDIDMASQLAHLDYPSPRPGLNPPPAPGVIPGADERQRNRDQAVAEYVGQGLDIEEANQLAIYEYPSPRPGPNPPPGPAPAPVPDGPVDPLTLLPQGFPRPAREEIAEQQYLNNLAELNTLLGYYRTIRGVKSLRGFLDHLLNYSRRLPSSVLDTSEEWLEKMSTTLFQPSDTFPDGFIDYIGEIDWSAPFVAEGGRKRKSRKAGKAGKTRKARKKGKSIKSIKLIKLKKSRRI